MNDLWANSDVPTEARRLRRLTEQTIVSSLREWLLRDYAATYCRSLATTRIFRRCYWIDALGAERKSEPPAAQEKGTLPASKRRKVNAPEALPDPLQPVVALSQQLTTEQERPITLHGLLLAGGSSHRKKNRVGSQQELAFHRGNGLIQASWLEAGPFVLKEMEQSPAIFLLNPFGASPFSYEDLAPLYQRTVPTELCLLISHKQIALLLQTAKKAKQEERRQATATLLTGLLRSDRWKSLPDEAEQAVMSWLELFKASIQRHFPLAVQSIDLPFKAGPARIDNAPYNLIFATRRQDSLVSMNDAVYHYHERVRSTSRSDILGEDWFATREQAHHKQDLYHLRQLLVQQGRTLRVRRWPDLRQQLLCAHFGQFTLHDYDMLIQQLLLNREMRCEWRQNSSKGADERIPGNDDTLVWR